MTDRYAVIGNPVAHSRSPDIHSAFAQQTAQDLDYIRLLAPIDSFAATLQAFRDEGGRPRLDLFFDTSAHGTHVAGIAAGRGIGGAPGFDGAAPGAQVIGLKIARNDVGGITTTGSVLAALEWLIEWVEARPA